MSGERIIASAIFAGLIFTTTGADAATVNLPIGPATLYLDGDIQNPVWVTFSLDAQIQLQTTPDPNDQLSYYILNIKLTAASGETTLQFAEIEGAIVENGWYPGGPPGLFFSDSNRTLQINPNPNFWNADLLSVTLLATLPADLSFRVVDPESVVAEVAEVTNNPLPAAAPLFASGIGSLGFLAWRRHRRMKMAAGHC